MIESLPLGEVMFIGLLVATADGASYIPAIKSYKAEMEHMICFLADKIRNGESPDDIKIPFQ